MSRPLSPTERGVVERLRAAGYVVAPLSTVVEKTLDVLLVSYELESEGVVALGDELLEALASLGSAPALPSSGEEVAGA
jgi:hypothetical protein